MPKFAKILCWCVFLKIKDMNVKHTRPKNLNLFTIHFPIPAIVSILHRISGLFLFLLIPILIWGFDLSMTSNGYQTIMRWFDSIIFKATVWIMLAALCFHLVAGVRHLLSDIHIGDTLKAGRMTAWLVFVVTAVLVILAGVWLW